MSYGIDFDDLTGMDIMAKAFGDSMKSNHLQDRVATYKLVQVLTDPVALDARAAAAIEGRIPNPAEGAGAIGKFQFYGRIRDRRAPVQPADPCNPTYATNTKLNNQLVGGHILFVTEEGLRPKKFGYVTAQVPVRLIGGEEVPNGFGTVIAITPNSSITPSDYTPGGACPDIQQITANGGVGHAGGPACPGSGPQPALDPGAMTAIYQGAYGPGAGAIVENGNYPENILRKVSTEHSTAPIKLLADVVDDFNRLAKAFHDEFGEPLRPTGGFRCYSGGQYCQVELKCRKGRDASIPGQSQHGWGLAFDYDTKGGFNSKFYKWMTSNSHKYNWVHPAWAKPGGSKPEAWHMEHRNVNTLITARKKAGLRPRPSSATAKATTPDKYQMGTTRTDEGLGEDGPGPVGGGEWVEGKNFVWVNKSKGQWKEIPVT